MPTDHPPVAPPAPAPTDPKPNRATRRAKRAQATPAPSALHGVAPPVHARGAQGRRINPVRRTG